MTTRLIIARHGNTFSKGQTPTRVGARTDLDLVESHRGSSVGHYLKDNNLMPDAVYSGPLKRHIQTTEQALAAMKSEKEISISHDFNEIDYGPDENKPEDEVIARIGEDAIKKWNDDATPPEGWDVDPDGIIQSWKDFATKVATEHKGENVLLVSSNGTIRFAPHITGDFEKFSTENDIKVATGGVCIFEYDEDSKSWNCNNWGLKPYKLYS